jgi:hypothetical protein
MVISEWKMEVKVVSRFVAAGEAEQIPGGPRALRRRPIIALGSVDSAFVTADIFV